MLTPEQKRAIEMQAAQAIRQSWGGLNGARVRGAIDDIRAKVIEEGWFGKTTTDQLNDMRYLANAPDKAGLGQMYEIGAEKLDAAWDAVFGTDTRNNELHQSASKPHERERDDPELER